MRAPTILLAALAFALPTALRTPALAADAAADAKAAAKAKAIANQQQFKKEKAEKEKAEKEKAEKEKAEKDKKANACSPTCTPTCDCDGKPIEPKKGEDAKADAGTKAGDAKAADRKQKEEDAKKKAEDAKKAAEEQKAAEAKAAGPIDALRKDRPDRRKQSADRLRRRWGVALTQPKAQDELKLHARRVAFLQRIRAAADAKKDKNTVEAVDELLTKEDERNSHTMNALREGALPAVTP